VFAATNVDYIIVLSVLFARRDLRFHSLSHRGKCSGEAPAGGGARWSSDLALPRPASTQSSG
jgi:hypothetical protein